LKEIDVIQALVAAVAAALRVPSQPEPQLVANLVWHITQEANRVRDLRAAGVFVHGQPHITCDNFPDKAPASVEIGDLLLLRSQQKAKGTLTNKRGLLLQAKKTDHIPTQPDNRNQHHIYAHWPQFTYRRHMKDLNGETRFVEGVDLFDASQYLLLGDSTLQATAPVPPFWHVWPFPEFGPAFTAHPSLPSLTHHQCFIQTLVAFILGDGGKSYDDPPRAGDIGWSQVIHDLITVTGKQASLYVQKASKSAHDGRLCFLTGDFRTDGTIAMQLANAGTSPSNDVLESGEPPDIPESTESIPDSAGGISIVEFIVGEGENA